MHFLWYRKFETTWSRYCIILPCPNAILIPHCGMLAHTHIRLLAQCRQRQSERQNQLKRELELNRAYTYSIPFTFSI